MREIGISPRFSRDKFVPLQTKQRYSTRDISGEVFLTLFFRGFVPFLSLADFVSRNKNLQVADLQRLKLYFGGLVTATTSNRQNEHPVAIRVPATDVITCGEPVETDYSVLNRYKVTHRGSKVAILALGSFYGLGQSVASLLKEKANIDATLINPRYITGVDNELMDELKADHELVITLEDGVLDGGFGEKIARYYGATNMKVLNFGAKKEFVDRYDIQEFLRANHLTDEQIVEDITAVIG